MTYRWSEIMGLAVARQNMKLVPVFAAWCRSGTDHWLSIRLEGRDGEWNGLRPYRDEQLRPIR